MTDADDRARTDRLANPAVLAKIRAVLPRSVQKADADDIAQKVLLRLLLIASLPPTLDRLLGLAVVVTRRVAFDQLRSAGRRLARESDVDDHAELLATPQAETSLDEADQIRLALEHVDAMFERGQVPESMVATARLLAEGKSTAEIAAMTGRTVAAVKMEASRLRKHLRAFWGQYVAGSVLLLLLVVFAARRRSPSTSPDFTIGPDVNAMGSSSAAPTSRPAASTAPAGSAERPSPVGLRGDAARMCEDHFYPECEKDLDEARKLDPTSDSLPEVKAMRAEIAQWKLDQAQPQQPRGPDKPPLRTKP